MKTMDVWEPTHAEYKMEGVNGQPLTLRDVPAQVNNKTGDIRFEADDLLIAEQEAIAARIGISARQIPILLLLRADSPSYTEKMEGSIYQRYRMNKMLFYYWKELELLGFGESFIHDSFESKQRGPVPAHLDDDATNLAEKDLINLVIGGKKIEKSWEYHSKSSKLLDELWNNTPEICKKAVTKAKKDLYLLDTTQMMHKVHEEHPEFRSTYTKPDES